MGPEPLPSLGSQTTKAMPVSAAAGLHNTTDTQRRTKEQLLKDDRCSPVVNTTSAKKWLESKQYVVKGKKYIMQTLGKALLLISQAAKMDKETYDGIQVVACTLEEARVLEMTLIISDAIKQQVTQMLEKQQDEQQQEKLNTLTELRQATDNLKEQVNGLKATATNATGTIDNIHNKLQDITKQIEETNNNHKGILMNFTWDANMNTPPTTYVSITSHQPLPAHATTITQGETAN